MKNGATAGTHSKSIQQSMPNTMLGTENKYANKIRTTFFNSFSLKKNIKIGNAKTFPTHEYIMTNQLFIQ